MGLRHEQGREHPMGKNLRLICMAFVATLAVALCACGGPDPASGIFALRNRFTMVTEGFLHSI